MSDRVKILQEPQEYCKAIEILIQQNNLNAAKKQVKQATEQFNTSAFKDNEDYLNLWFYLIDLERAFGSDYHTITSIFKYLGQKRIGVKNSKLYKKWAKFEASFGFKDRAKMILQAAIDSQVDPVEDLELCLKNLSIERIPLATLSSTPSQIMPADHESSGNKLLSESKTTTKSSRFRSKLGPPARYPKGYTSVDLPSPESLLSSPSEKNAISSNHSTPIPNQSEAPQNLPSDSDSSDSSFVLDLTQKERTVMETVNMDLSSTVILSHPTPKAATCSNPVLRPGPPVFEESTADEAKLFVKDTVEINGKSYQKCNLIGKGGSCKVWKITDSSGQVFALKKVKLRGQDASVIEGYKNEIILLNKLKTNDRIIRLFDAEHDKTQKVLLMVLEYGEIDLERMLQKDSALTVNFIRNYWEQMLQAVQAIHRVNIIHSDLKPANFLLVGGCLKLIDFGIAKSIPNDTTNIQRDHQSGTVNYMAPEAINYVEIGGAKQNYLKQGRASDVWSLACILYRFIYLSPPFGKMPLMVKIHAITNPNQIIPYPPSKYPEAVDVIQKCLLFDSKKRLTIPQLLEHPFLTAGRKLTADIVAAILRRGLDLGLDNLNYDKTVEMICEEYHL